MGRSNTKQGEAAATDVNVIVDVAALPSYRRAHVALRSGNSVEATDALRLAHRLAPHDAHVSMALANLLLPKLDQTTGDIFRSILETHDVLEAWLGLVLFESAVGHVVQAAEALHSMLRGHVVYHALSMAPTFDKVAAQGSRSIWCGLHMPNELVVRPILGTAMNDIRLTCDSAIVCYRSRQDGSTVLFDLSDIPVSASNLEISVDGQHPLGSPINFTEINRIEGGVDTTDAGGLRGWAWYPRQTRTLPQIVLSSDGSELLRTMAAQPLPTIKHPRPFALPRSFEVEPAELSRFQGPVRVHDHFDRELAGSPLSPTLWQRSAVAAAENVARQWPARAVSSSASSDHRSPALHCVPAHVFGILPHRKKRPSSIDIIIPVHNAMTESLACLASVRDDLPSWARIIVVDDASTDGQLTRSLQEMHQRGDIHLLRQKRACGFPCAVNHGMRFSRRDVVLLNSDTIVYPNWLTRLREAAYLTADTGTVTPLSNNASMLSFPRPDIYNATLPLEHAAAIDAIAGDVNAGLLIEIPTAVGFCMYIKRACLDQTGLFREDIFAQGYGEENDFSLRARQLGWRNLAAPNIFVTHLGGRSFGAAKTFLMERNIKVLNRLYPGYDTWLAAATYESYLRPARRRIEVGIWNARKSDAPSVLFVTHGKKGGVQRVISDRSRQVCASGNRAILLTPARLEDGTYHCVLSDGEVGETPNLSFALPGEADLLMSFIGDQKPIHAEVHHLEGHDHQLLILLKSMGIVYDYVIHDYACFCPRFFLVHGRAHYCGEPAPYDCEACIADYGQHSQELIAVSTLVDRSDAELRGARQVVAPSQDVSARMRRHFPNISCLTEPWEQDPPSAAFQPDSRPPYGEHARVAVIGAISPEKGFEILLALCRDATSRQLPIHYLVVGYTCGDDRLLDCGHVTITGPYAENECLPLIRSQRADLCLLPSVCPETWCFSLSSAWQAGLKVVALDIGAPAARIRANGLGVVLPLGFPAHMMNDQLLLLSRQSRQQRRGLKPA